MYGYNVTAVNQETGSFIIEKKYKWSSSYPNDYLVKSTKGNLNKGFFVLSINRT